MSHSTVAHRWFHQIGNKTTGRNSFEVGNMFYDNKIIYSYGKHFALGIRFDKIVVMNKKGYSSSTGKHFSHVYGATDTFTHEIISVPLKEAYYIDSDIDFKKVYRYIDFNDFVWDFRANLKKLGNARKPEKYTIEIDGLKSELEKIFSLWRGSKTLALKTKGIRSILNFEFNDDVKNKMKKLRAAELAKITARKKAKYGEALEALRLYEAGEKSLGWGVADTLGLNTVIRVKGGAIETSKGMGIDLKEGLRIFKIWDAGKALGVEIKTKDGHVWKCTKVNGIIKFGCHEVEYVQAKRVLTPYL